MIIFKILILSTSVFFTLGSNDLTNENNVKPAENRMALQIFAMLDHFKQPDPVGLPMESIPDPMPIPDITQNVALATMHIKNATVKGLSRFRVISLKTDVYRLRAEIVLKIDETSMVGNYQMSLPFFSKASGPFQVHMKNVVVMGNATLSVTRNGTLQATGIEMDITYDKLSMDFENLGKASAMLQTMVTSSPDTIFNLIKPYMMKDAYSKMKEEINANIHTMSGGHVFANSISPLDVAIADTRKYVRQLGYDPYEIPDYNHPINKYVKAVMKNTRLSGVSSFYRNGNVSMEMVNNNVTICLQLATQKIMGTTQWEVSLLGVLGRSGCAQFWVDHFKVTIVMTQPLDVSKRAQIKDLKLELGNIQMRSEGTGTLDYAIEFGVNILPNLLRYQIITAMEKPIMNRIQEKLDHFDLEVFLKNNINAVFDGGFEFKY